MEQTLLLLTAAGLLAVRLVGATTDPALDGPFPSFQQTVAIPGTQGETLDTDVYHPGTSAEVSSGADRCPVVVLGHGFAQSRNQHVNQGLHLASRGYIVLIPDSNEAANHSRFADDLSRCIDWITARNSDSASIFHGRVRVDRIGASGHSAGGLSAIVAASRDPRIRAVSPMDPVDSGGLGVAALADVRVPVAVTFSEPSACNSSGSALTLYEAASAPKRGIKIVGANHTDPQDPASPLSALFCGPADSGRQALYRRYMVGWFDYHLRGDAAYGPWVYDQPGGELASDLAAGRITYARAAAPLEGWRRVCFGAGADDPSVAGDSADPDFDGLSNLHEYAFNTDPQDGSGGAPQEAEFVGVGENEYVAIRFPLVTDASDVTLRVEVSGNLQDWQPGSSYAGQERIQVTTATTEFSATGSGREVITVRDNVAVGSASSRFIRVVVSRP